MRMCGGVASSAWIMKLQLVIVGAVGIKRLSISYFATYYVFLRFKVLRTSVWLSFLKALLLLCIYLRALRP